MFTRFGGRYNENVYHVPLEGTVLNYNICQLEMLNVLVALRVWGHQFKNRKLTIKCDNLPAVNVLTNGKTGDKLLAAIARNIQMQAAKDNIPMNIIHIEGKKNSVADLFSRWQQYPNMSGLHKFINKPVWVMFPKNYLEINFNI